jgi:hypothetical protein
MLGKSGSGVGVGKQTMLGFGPLQELLLPLLLLPPPPPRLGGKYGGGLGGVDGNGELGNVVVFEQ